MSHDVCCCKQVSDSPVTTSKHMSIDSTQDVLHSFRTGFVLSILIQCFKINVIFELLFYSQCSECPAIHTEVRHYMHFIMGCNFFVISLVTWFCHYLYVFLEWEGCQNLRIPRKPQDGPHDLDLKCSQFEPEVSITSMKTHDDNKVTLTKDVTKIIVQWQKGN